MLSAPPGASDTFLLDRIVALADSGGVHKHDRQTVKIEVYFQRVSGRAGARRDDRDVPLRQGIQQGRLAGVGRASDDDRETITQPLATVAVPFEQVRDRIAYRP